MRAANFFIPPPQPTLSPHQHFYCGTIWLQLLCWICSHRSRLPRLTLVQCISMNRKWDHNLPALWLNLQFSIINVEKSGSRLIGIIPMTWELKLNQSLGWVAILSAAAAGIKLRWDYIRSCGPLGLRVMQWELIIPIKARARQDPGRWE